MDKCILDYLKRLNIEVTDSFSEETEIDLLVGANVFGHLLTEKSVILDSGLIVT